MVALGEVHVFPLRLHLIPFTRPSHLFDLTILFTEKAGAMAFRIHEDQENATLGLKKENADVFAAANQRRALGNISHFACNQNRNIQLVSIILASFHIHSFLLFCH